MQKSYLTAFHNDPKLNKYPQDKKIQPLFKKSFILRDDLIKKQLEDSEISRTHHLSETFNPRPPSDIIIKSRNVSSSKLDPNSEHSREQLEYLISKLRSEKLEMLKELSTYEEKYEHKLCLKARLEEMKGLCSELLDMSKIASERLNTENDLYGYLQMGMMTLNQERLGSEDNSDDEVLQRDFDFYPLLVAISGVACVCFISRTEDDSIKLSIYPYLFSQSFGADLNAPIEGESIEEIVEQTMIPFLAISYEDSLNLKVVESPPEIFKLWSKLENIDLPVELTAVLGSTFVEIEALECKITVEEPYLIQLLRNGKTLEANVYISKNLIMLNEEKQNTLVWKAKAWDIEKHQLKQSGKALVLRERQDVLSSFERFYRICYKVFIPKYVIDAEVWINLITNKIKIILTKDGITTVLREEIYPDEFCMLKLLQDFDLESSKLTISSSLEFLHFLSKFLTEKI